MHVNSYVKTEVSDLDSEWEPELGCAMVYEDEYYYYMCYGGEIDDCTDLSYVCYYDNDTTSTLCSVVNKDNCFTKDDKELLLQLKELSISRSENMDIIRMINYQRQIVGIESGDDLLQCERFDLECELIDNYPDLFSNFKNDMQAAIMEKLALSSSARARSTMDNDLTQLLYELVCTKVVVSKKMLWCYDDMKMKWIEYDDDNFLHMLIVHYYIPLLEKEGLTNAWEYAQFSTTRTKLVKDVKNRLAYPGFENKIDSNYNTIGVNNGTLCLLTGVVRDRKLKDLISKTTNIDYIPYSPETVEMKLLMKLLRQVFPDNDQLRFFIASCGTFLERRNSQKVFYVWWGSGNNCKTGMATLIQNALGDYCGSAPVSLITGKRGNSGAATPELNGIEGKLAVFLQEPNPGEKLKTGRIKELTGNDQVYIRKLFQEGKNISITSKFIHVCNFPTAGSDTDSAFKSRIRVIKFMSTFLDEDEYEYRRENNMLDDHTYKIESDMDHIYQVLAPYFLSLIVHEYRQFKKNNVLCYPDIVKRHTMEFLTHLNWPLKFIRKHIIRSTEAEPIKASTIYEIFKQWFKTNFPSYSVPIMEIFSKQLLDERYKEDVDGYITNAIVDNNIDILI